MTTAQGTVGRPRASRHVLGAANGAGTVGPRQARRPHPDWPDRELVVVAGATQDTTRLRPDPHGGPHPFLWRSVARDADVAETAPERLRQRIVPERLPVDFHDAVLADPCGAGDVGRV